MLTHSQLIAALCPPLATQKRTPYPSHVTHDDATPNKARLLIHRGVQVYQSTYLLYVVRYTA